jgi:hypothetical protein
MKQKVLNLNLNSSKTAGAGLGPRQWGRNIDEKPDLNQATASGRGA